MADQTHILRLKATLDTSEVKSKLDQLRQAQKQAIAGGQASNATGGMSGGNLSLLTSTLQRLNTTMMQMQQAISRLAMGQTRDINSSPTPYIPIGDFRQKNIKPTSNKGVLYNGVGHYYKNTESLLYKMFKNPKHNINNLRKMTYGIDESTGNFGWTDFAEMAKNNPQSFRYISERRAKGLPYDQRLRNATRKALKDIYGGSISKPNLSLWSPYNETYKKPGISPLAKFGMGMLGNQVLGQVGEYAQATGNTGMSRAIGIGQYAIMGAAAGGPIGAVVGAGFGAVSEAFSVLTERTKALSDAMQEQENRVKTAKDVDIGLKKKLQNETDAKRLRVGDIGYFQGRIDFKKGLLSKLTKQQEEIGIAPGSLTAYEEETQRQIEAFREGSPSGELPDSIKRRQRLANRYKANISTIEQIKSDITGYEGNLESLGVISEKKQDAKDFQENSKRQEQWRLVAMRDIYQKDYEEIDARKKALYTEAESKGITVSLDKLEDLQDQLDALDEKLKVVNSELDRRAEELKEQRSRERDDKIEHLQETLTNMKAPNMQGISNLASYGMAGSLKDDQARLETMVDYQKEQYRIQTEIRDLMREKKEEETPTVWG